MNGISRALSILGLSAVFSAAAFAQNPARAPLPDAPHPQPAARPGFIPRAIGFFNRHAVENGGHTYDFALQQPVLKRRNFTLSLEGGTLDGNFGNPKLNADRDMLRAVMGIKRDDPCTLCTNLYPGTNDNRHADGFAAGIRLTFGR